MKERAHLKAKKPKSEARIGHLKTKKQFLKIVLLKIECFYTFVLAHTSEQSVANFFILEISTKMFIAQWIRLSLPSCHPEFVPQTHHLFYQFVFTLSYGKDENIQKEAGIGPFKKPFWTECSIKGYLLA